MIIVGLTNCDGCKIYKNMHPEYTYLELGKDCIIPTDKRIKLKKTLEKLKWDKKAPALLNDSMTILKLRSDIVKEEGEL